MLFIMGLCLIVIGICFQITAYKRRNFGLFRLGFYLSEVPSLGNGFLCCQYPNFYVNLMGLGLLAIGFINAMVYKRVGYRFDNKQKVNKAMLVHVRVVGSKKKVAEYFDSYGLEMPELLAEDDGQYSCTHKVYLDRLPVVQVLNGFVLDINPEGNSNRWQFQFGTKFGTKESHVFDVIDTFIRYKDPNEIHHHFDFKDGKVWVHLVDFNPLDWKCAG